MTAKEKLRLDHPTWNNFTFYKTLDSDCPHDYEYLEAPELTWCHGNSCEECWDREIPGTEKVTPDTKEARIKLDTPVPTMDKFVYRCAKCMAYLFESDNFCPSCGENVSGCLGVVILSGVLDEPEEKTEFTEEDAIHFWEEADTNG